MGGAPPTAGGGGTGPDCAEGATDGSTAVDAVGAVLAVTGSDDAGPGRSSTTSTCGVPYGSTRRGGSRSTRLSASRADNTLTRPIVYGHTRLLVGVAGASRAAVRASRNDASQTR